MKFSCGVLLHFPIYTPPLSLSIHFLFFFILLFFSFSLIQNTIMIFVFSFYFSFYILKNLDFLSKRNFRVN